MEEVKLEAKNIEDNKKKAIALCTFTQSEEATE